MKSYKFNNSGRFLDESTSHSGLFTIIILVLIFINLSYLFFNNGGQMSFSSLLYGLSEMPSVDVDVVRNFSQSRITADWSLWLSKDLGIGISFNWLRDFINSFIMPLLSMVAFFLAGLTQLIVFIGWVIGFIFGR
ncbi:MAG: hypothetical protein SOY02_06590 [Candidatus Onthovivens sp.]|nr:hypothetical protein [Candidatus Onthovivens sp.]